MSYDRPLNSSVLLRARTHLATIPRGFILKSGLKTDRGIREWNLDEMSIQHIPKEMNYLFSTFFRAFFLRRFRCIRDIRRGLAAALTTDDFIELTGVASRCCCACSLFDAFNAFRYHLADMVGIFLSFARELDPMYSFRFLSSRYE